MWIRYTFKLAYANDNTFTMTVNTDWTLLEFENKVRDYARMVFPQINIEDTFHITESWNYLGRTDYFTIPSEENTPLLTQDNYTDYICERYINNYRQNLDFYIYFRDLCTSLRYTRLEGGPVSTEMVDLSYDYYYDIYLSNIEETNNDLRRNRDNVNYISPENPPIFGTFDNSTAVSLDDMMLHQPSPENTPSHFNNFLNNSYFNIPSSVAEFALNDNDYNIIPRNLEYDWSGGLNNTSTEETIPLNQSSDCCICFNNNQCFTLNGCNHTVCVDCYRGVFNRINGELDTRCPICRNSNAFTYDIYNSLDLYDDL